MIRRNILTCIDKIAFSFEIVIAFMLLLIIAVKVLEMSLSMIGLNIIIVQMDFERILSIILTFVIGIEFTKMLCKHTPETVMDVLLFAIARQMVIYHDNTIDLLIGTIAIAGLFAAKRYLINNKVDSPVIVGRDEAGESS